ncbi:MULTISPECIES: MFS transporter [unclassified Flavobacterium]|uniref:MFS transporter n=1 Tax=unclassified Flavobacterium TaxID=196869 RepID=UPI00095E5C80|nr:MULTISPECIES: MFS transporter [unclassified Flavobacterium]MBN9285534.1 MFS transporter [Flavobacterium sp.]OJV71521.1 MAG: MFS transporter [Flavobacterium sp. 40-81]
MIHLEKGSKKLLNAWAFYDWANSVYALVISSSIFPLYYGALFRIKEIEEIPLFGLSIRSEALISYITAIGFLVVAILSPLLSGIADYLGNKKTFLKFFCYMGSLSCMGLYFFSLDNIIIGLLTYMLALIGFWGSLVFYNSYLPDIAFPEQQDSISAKGYGLGYVGSVILLIINLIMVMKFETFGFENQLKAMQFSFVLVGLWWMGFSQYTYRYLPDYKNGKKIQKQIIFNGFKELQKVWSQLKEIKPLKRYLGAFFVYSMAVQTVMIVAAYFGEKEVAWGSDEKRTMGLIVSILLIQLIAVFGAFITSKASAKFGNIRVLMLINFLWILICIYAYFVVTPNEFYIAASCVGLVMGGIQSLSRSTYSKLIPKTQDTTSFFSFYDVSEKIGIVIGMFLYGYIADITGKMQNAILFLIVFFVAGLILLTRVPKE